MKNVYELYTNRVDGVKNRMEPGMRESTESIAISMVMDIGGGWWI